MDHAPRERARPQVFPIKALEKGLGSVTGKREFPGKEGFGPFGGVEGPVEPQLAAELAGLP